NRAFTGRRDQSRGHGRAQKADQPRFKFHNQQGAVMFDPLLAWSWTGHGQLTALGLAWAISKLVPLGKTFVLQRLHQFSAIRQAIEIDSLGTPGFPPTDKEVADELKKIENHSPSMMEQSLILLFDDLPSRVQTEDIHVGNIPW